jgi:hypothetical protein
MRAAVEVFLSEDLERDAALRRLMLIRTADPSEDREVDRLTNLGRNAPTPSAASADGQRKRSTTHAIPGAGQPCVRGDERDAERFGQRDVGHVVARHPMPQQFPAAVKQWPVSGAAKGEVDEVVQRQVGAAVGEAVRGGRLPQNRGHLQIDHVRCGEDFSVERSRARWPSSLSAGVRTLTPTTIAVVSHRLHRVTERHASAGSSTCPVEHLVESRCARLFNQLCEQVLLQ